MDLDGSGWIWMDLNVQIQIQMPTQIETRIPDTNLVQLFDITTENRGIYMDFMDFHGFSSIFKDFHGILGSRKSSKVELEAPGSLLISF